jgi:hypothetical protein
MHWYVCELNTGRRVSVDGQVMKEVEGGQEKQLRRFSSKTLGAQLASCKSPLTFDSGDILPLHSGFNKIETCNAAQSKP